MNTKYDIVVIGAGSGGLTAAVGFSKVGKRVLLVEREHMGGECTNTGCVPSKALLHHAKTYYAAKKVHGETTSGETYRAAAFNYVRNTIDSILAEETPETFEKLGIDVVKGEAAFSGSKEITIDGLVYGFNTAIIATGSSPRILDIPGLDEKHILTNQNIFELPDVPAKLLIIGGGPIGMEMAQACAMLGSEVALVERGEQFAAHEDESIRPLLHQAFTDLGITIHTGATIQEVEGSTAHFVQTHTVGDEAIHRLSTTFDKVLIAIGRTPNLPAGLEQAGIIHDTDSVVIDSQYRTTNKRVYAIGDVSQQLKFTHTADDVARQVVARVASRGLLRVKQNKSVPKVTYTSPEVAQAGLSFDDAVARYSKDQIMRIEVPFSHNDRARTDSTTDGVLVVIAKRLGGKVIGAHIIGPTAGELITIFTLAIDQNVSLWKLQKTIFPYPTYSLIIKKAADQFVSRQVSDLKTDLLNITRRHTLKIVAAVIWITAVINLHQYQTVQGLTATDAAVQLFNFITLTVWGPLLYVLIYAVRPVTFFPATALTILSGIFFGLVWGTALTLIAATLAATVAYGVGRFFGSNVRLEDTIVGDSVTALREHTFGTILTMRLLFLPFDLLSYAAGILRAPFVPFIAATFVGIILGTATFVSIGASLNLEEFIANGVSVDLLEPRLLALSAAICITSLIVARGLKRWQAT